MRRKLTEQKTIRFRESYNQIKNQRDIDGALEGLGEL
jgi:hypothetical protein